MDTQRHARVKELFLRICELPEEERREALQQACGTDRDLRKEVESLLGFHDATEASSQPASVIAEEPLPERIGDYAVLDKLGEGGMGVVYKVRQEKPVRRTLALKLVKWGMDSREVLARFEAERQALALMEHPNIAKMHEAGVTEQGRPYFTMEFVDGEPITSYCDRHCLSIEERLGQFLSVCAGVQHAHRRGIIHRDLKSSNILVRPGEAGPVPVIIDFGVAKATQHHLTERTLYTQQGMLIGTPEYMSPEQAELTGTDIDTRTDVYSLGVVLYELLVGSLPFDFRTSGTSFDEIRRQIREDEPPRPSTRLGLLSADAAAEAARRRREELPALRKTLRGDLDWITMQALEKDRGRRYATPREMAADIERYLRHEPVTAGPPRTIYRTRKFVRRHRFGVAAGAAIAFALLIGLTFGAVSLVRARKAERAARKEAETATRASELLIGLFDDMNTSVPGYITTLEELLDRGTQRIEDELADEPALQVRLMGTVSGAYAGLGMGEKGRALAEQTLATCRERLPPDHPYLAMTLSFLGDISAESGELDRAERLQEEALDIWQRTLGPDTVTLSQARTHHALGAIRLRRGDFPGARSHLEAAEAIFDRGQWPYRQHLAHILYTRALLDTEGTLDHRAAVPRLVKALDILEERFGPNDAVQLGSVRFWLGQVHFRLGDLETAREYYESLEDLYRRTTGPESPGAAWAAAGLGEILAAQGNLEEARVRLEDAEAILDAHGVPGSDREWFHRCLAAVYRRSGEVDRARRLLERTLADLEASVGREHPLLSRTLHGLGLLELRAGNLERARRWYRRALEVQGHAWDPGHRVNGAAFYRLAGIAALEGDREHALVLLGDAMECGFRTEGIREEPSLVSLHGDPEFEELAARLRSQEK